jgi:hypothetical protein
MTLTVDTNSYISRTNATTYFSNSLKSNDWAAITDNNKDLALMSATRMLDRQTWMGSKTSSSQALEWPRTSVTDKYGTTVSSSAVPQQVLDACCELALALAMDGTVETNRSTSSNIKSLKAAEAQVQYFRPVTGGRFPTVTQELIAQFLLTGTAGSISAPTVTGNCGTSQFDCNPYGVNDGYS